MRCLTNGVSIRAVVETAVARSQPPHPNSILFDRYAFVRCDRPAVLVPGQTRVGTAAPVAEDVNGVTFPLDEKAGRHFAQDWRRWTEQQKTIVYYRNFR